MPFEFIAGSEGDNAIGSKNLELGPCNAYYGSFAETNLAGTISASGTASITGTGTSFNTTLKPGDWVKAGSVTFQVKTIASATAMTAMAPVTLTTATFFKIDAVFLGGTDSTLLKFGLTKQDLMESQNGTTAADRAITGYSASVELGLTRSTLVRMEKLLQGFQGVRDATTGLYKGAGFGFPIGETDLDIAKELRLVKLIGGIESVEPLETIRVLKCAPSSENEAAFDAGTQRIFKVTFNAYRDDSVVINGVPQIFTMGVVS